MDAVQTPSSTSAYLGHYLGNYRLTKIVGQGGFATIYVGKHRYLGTYAAVKVLHTQLSGEQSAKFAAEARIAARLVHPHIVRVLEFGLEGQTPFLVMDYAPHGTLRHRYTAAGTQPDLAVIVRYVKQIAGALHYIHSHGFIHQDIKPENILFGSYDRVLLSDFGITITVHQASIPGTRERIGTIHYMAPEQLQGQPCFASDQYALGVLLYEWLCGEVPFAGSTLAITAQHLFSEPPSLCEKVPTVPVAVEQVILRALAKDPEQRFASVQAFALALEQAYKQSQTFQHQPVVLRPAPVTPAKPLVLKQPQAVTSQPASLAQVRGIQPILLASRPKKPAAKKRNIWREISRIFAVDIAVGSVVGIILLILGLNIQTIWFFISLCLVSTPLLAAGATRNRPVFFISTAFLAVASVLGIGFHSFILFAIVYGGLTFLSLLIAFSGSLQNFNK